MHLVLYKLRDIENLKEILKISKKFGIRIHIIRREGSDIDYDSLKSIYDFELYSDFNEFLEKYSNLKFLILETYGNKLLLDINLKDYDAFILGAEDIGIPMYEIEKIKYKDVVKIPSSFPDSYNVTSTLVMLLSELFL